MQSGLMENLFVFWDSRRCLMNELGDLQTIGSPWFSFTPKRARTSPCICFSRQLFPSLQPCLAKRKYRRFRELLNLKVNVHETSSELQGKHAITPCKAGDVRVLLGRSSGESLPLTQREEKWNNGANHRTLDDGASFFHRLVVSAAVQSAQMKRDPHEQGCLISANDQEGLRIPLDTGRSRGFKDPKPRAQGPIFGRERKVTGVGRGHL
ncbi:hypothetical protein HCBG_08102 [Histoplasma capsulatum G186AR]|uniref:Uncharacterized protein n=1 Tax=Ajellomyces capsulatus (strain G186AR / H82 / ATCC MYA-2454 / RMSCC 2432) TaxID=447093 RepID=C0NXB0_AJECG|nr:uncharacterized protein HCBG_08102 [Histoplasma capsulatum G186AR]EEH03976.1 hypothetical protein HCBG_08102 [Histoplasma capsulatum G186AR]